MHSKLFRSLSALALIGLAACNGNPQPTGSAGGNTAADTTASLPNISLPTGFSIKVYAEVPNARSLCRNGNTVYIGSMSGKVYAVTDTNGDGTADHVYTIASGLDTPNGIAYKDGTLFIAEVGRLLRIDGGRQHLVGSGLHGQLIVGRVQPGQCLAGLHPVTHLDKPLDDLATGSESQIAFDACAHHRGEGAGLR